MSEYAHSMQTPAPRYADVAVTATAKEFAGVYRGKQYHEPDFDAVLDRAVNAGVKKVMLTGMSLNDVEFNLNIARQRPSQCRITVGTHPYHASELETETEQKMAEMASTIVRLMTSEPRLIGAYGELGLDYDRLEHASRDTQLRAFRAQLDLFVSEKFDLPLFLHCRAAFDDFVEVIQPYMAHLHRRGLVHSFVGSAVQMNALVDMGLDVSVNGFSFRDAESLDMVRQIPLERLQIETDAPWGVIPANSEVSKLYLTNAPPMPQSKKRDKFEKGYMVKERNESCTMNRVALVVAGLRGCDVSEIIDCCWRNSVAMFWPDEARVLIGDTVKAV